MSLDVRTLINTIEQTLLDLLSLGYQVRRAPVASIAALRATPAKTVADRDLVYVDDQDNLYRWSQASTAADDGLAVVAPTDPPYAPATNGRWLRVSTPATFGPNQNAPLQKKQTGYARSVVLYQGEGQGTSAKQIAESIFGRSPAILIQWLGDDPRLRSQYPGALYWDNLEFQILVYSESLRGQPWTALGSPQAAEVARDPGLNRMVGDVRYLLAGIQHTGVDGIESVEIGRSDIVSQDLEDRVFVAGVQIIVRTSWTIPDEDLEAMRIQLRPQHPVTIEDLPKFDPLNYVASGLTVQVGTGRTRTPAPGIVFIAGVAIVVTPPAVTFAADSDVYRDVKPDATVTYVSVPAGSKTPAVTSGALRVGVTTTNAADILQDKILCSYSTPLRFPPGSMTVE